MPTKDPDEPRADAPGETLPDNVIAIGEARARLGPGRLRKRWDALLDAANPEDEVQALPGEELFQLIREHGADATRDLAAYATGEQIQVVLDFGLWSGDRLTPERLSEWAAFIAEMPDDTLERWAPAIDTELLALLIRRAAVIYDLNLEEPPDEPRGVFYSTPDTFFVLDVTGFEADDEPGNADGAGDAGVLDGDASGDGPSVSARALIQILDAFYRTDKDFARRILVGARAELETSLEEMAFRWRQGRMADLGFAAQSEALDVYRELDPASVRIGEMRPGTRITTLSAPGPQAVPATTAEHLAGTSPFARAVAHVTARAELDEIHFALLTLTNRVLAADAVDPSAAAAMAATVHKVHATLDLAVEFLARGASGVFDEERAVDAVRTIPMQRLFRLGISLVGKLKKLAHALVSQGPFPRARFAELIEEPDASVLAALARPRAAYVGELDAPATPGERPFSSMADLARTSVAIQRAAATQALLRGLGVTPEQISAIGQHAVVVLPERDVGAGARGRPRPARARGGGKATQPAGPSAPADQVDAGALARTALVLHLLLDKHDGATARPETPGIELRALSSLELRRFLARAEQKAPGQDATTRPRKAPAPAASAANAGSSDQGPGTLEERARAILEAVAARAIPPALLDAARQVIDRWAAGLVPLGPVLVATSASAPAETPEAPVAPRIRRPASAKKRPTSRGAGTTARTKRKPRS